MENKKLDFSLPVMIFKQGRRFVGYTPALDISTSGKTEKEVKARFVDLATLFFEEIEAAGTTNAVLSELGWKKVQKKWMPPRVVSSQSVAFCAPVLA